MKINIVLLNPEIPQNTGNISRTCAATGASLHLIKPLGFSTEDKHLKRAGLDYWKYLDIHYYDNFEEFLNKNNDGNLIFFTTKSDTVYSDKKYEGDVFLIFGPESRGIPEEILAPRKDQCVRIPMIEEARSLNLSNTAAIAVYEVLRQNNFESLTTKGNLHRLNWK